LSFLWKRAGHIDDDKVSTKALLITAVYPEILFGFEECFGKLFFIIAKQEGFGALSESVPWDELGAFEQVRKRLVVLEPELWNLHEYWASMMRRHGASECTLYGRPMPVDSGVMAWFGRPIVDL
jgi:hypothetical protein